jgi:hypothetical protein
VENDTPPEINVPVLIRPPLPVKRRFPTPEPEREHVGILAACLITKYDQRQSVEKLDYPFIENRPRWQ